MQSVDQEQPEPRMRRHQIDLEFRAGGNLASLLQPLELGIRAFGDIGIEQIVETDVLRLDAGLERIALAPGAACVDAEELAGFNKGRIFQKYRLEPADPVATLAGLTVRQPLDARAERTAHLFEDFAGARHGHAADEIDVARHLFLPLL